MPVLQVLLLACPACKFSIFVTIICGYYAPEQITHAGFFMPDACFLMKLSKLLPQKGNNFSSYDNCSLNDGWRGIYVSYTG